MVVFAFPIFNLDSLQVSFYYTFENFLIYCVVISHSRDCVGYLVNSFEIFSLSFDMLLIGVVKNWYRLVLDSPCSGFVLFRPAGA